MSDTKNSMEVASETFTNGDESNVNDGFTSFGPRVNFDETMNLMFQALPSERGNMKLWMRQNNMRLMAGTCACKSSRLTSGFEMQCWAFVPRVNIRLGAAVSEKLQS